LIAQGEIAIAIQTNKDNNLGINLLNLFLVLTLAVTKNAIQIIKDIKLNCIFDSPSKSIITFILDHNQPAVNIAKYILKYHKKPKIHNLVKNKIQITAEISKSDVNLIVNAKPNNSQIIQNNFNISIFCRGEPCIHPFL
jgi:hypothetical protein